MKFLSSAGSFFHHFSMILTKVRIVFRTVVYPTTKSMALATNGVSIHHPVTRAHAGCPASQGKRQVCKSVRTSNKPRNTLNKRNFRIWNILEEAINCCQPTILSNSFQFFPSSFAPFVSRSATISSQPHFTAFSCMLKNGNVL